MNVQFSGHSVCGGGRASGPTGEVPGRSVQDHGTLLERRSVEEADLRPTPQYILDRSGIHKHKGTRRRKRHIVNNQSILLKTEETKLHFLVSLSLAFLLFFSV